MMAMIATLMRAGTGNLSIRSEGLVKLGTITGSETCLNAYANGAVELYYDNSKKLETASDKILFMHTPK